MSSSSGSQQETVIIPGRYFIPRPDHEKKMEIACATDDLEQVKALLAADDPEQEIDIRAQSFYSLRLACMNGCLRVVRYLMESESTKRRINLVAVEDSIRAACADGQRRVAEYLVNQRPELSMRRIMNLDMDDFSKIPKKDLIQMVQERDTRIYLEETIGQGKTGRTKNPGNCL